MKHLIFLITSALWPLSSLSFPLDYDYSKVLNLSLLFFEAQRSGHVPHSRIPWRGDSALYDKGQRGEDLTGGYYDGSDSIKFGFTMAFATTLLGWGVSSYENAYKASGQYLNCLEAIKWASDYFIKCHVSPHELYGQVGDFELDIQFWGRPEELNMSRPAFKIDEERPGSELAGETAAALAVTSLLFRNVDKAYADECLKHARELYEFAVNFRGLYNDVIPGAKTVYESNDYGDDLTWSALWLYKATNDSKYLSETESNYENFRLKERPNEFFLNKKVAGIQVLLAEITKQPEYLEAVKSFCNYSVRKQKRTPKGLVYIEKCGTLSHAANIAFVCLKAADLGMNVDEYRNFAKDQIGYMLGDTGRSFVVGYGVDYPRQPYHAASSCPDVPEPCDWFAYNSTKPNPQILYGALVSGPDENDLYIDARDEYLYSQVFLDYNAGFQGAVAGLLELQVGK